MRAWLYAAVVVALGSGTAWAAGSLVDAVQRGDRAAALALLQQRTDVNQRAPDGTTALHWAVHRNDAELVERLLRAGAKADVANDYGATPMSEAAVVGNPAVIRMLLEAGADVESPNADGQTALMILARTSNVEAAKLLLERGANVNAREKWRGQTALMWAAAQSQPAMVRLLVEHGADVDARSMVNEWERQITAEPRAQYRPSGGLTPLLYAAREGCLECTKILVEAGADLDLADPDGISPMLMATLNFNFDVAAHLLEAGANPNKWDWWGRTPLYAAVDLNTIPRGGRPDRPSLDETSSLELIERLLEAGANPNAQLKLFPPYRAFGPDRGADAMLTIGTTPLVRAAKAGDADAIRVLLAHGADPNLPTSQGITPVMAAAGLGSNSIDTRGRFLIDTGSPQMQAAAVEALKVLLAAGGKINAANNRGQTALHGAAYWGWNDVVAFLAANGARLDAKDGQGKTPLDSAMGRAGGHGRGGQTIIVHEDTAALLEKLMAQRNEAPQEQRAGLVSDTAAARRP